MSWVFKHSDAKLGARLVLLALADNADEEGGDAYPSVPTIARKTRLSERQVQNCLRQLEDEGAIRNSGRHARGMNIYTVVMAEGGADIAPGAVLDIEGVQSTTEGVQSTTPGGELEFTRTIPTHPEEPSIEPSPLFEVAPKPMEVWEHYVAVMRPRRAVLDDQERKIIKDALKVATVDECNRAIDGCANSPFHMGSNDRRRKYNSISQILKGRPGRETTRERIDYFITLAGDESRDPLADVQSPILREKIRRYRRMVVEMYQSPTSGRREHGEQALKWLRENRNEEPMIVNDKVTGWREIA
jgi:hypothetical protein